MPFPTVPGCGQALVAARRRRVLLALPVCAVILCGCAASARVNPASQSVPDALQSLAQKHHVCAVTLAVIKNRQLASIDTATACPPPKTVDADSVFQAASLSKPVFAYAVLKLAAQGRIDLDAPVMRYLPQGYRHRVDPLKAEPAELATDPRLQAITARMVLNHTSGLPNWASGPLKVVSTPGTAWDYSGEGYVLLQRAVESITGQPLDQVMAEQVFAPSGMQRSRYRWNETIARHLQPGTRANGAPRTTLNMTEPIAAFSLYTTASDYAKFLVRLSGDAAAIQQTVTVAVAADPAQGIDWGLGWGIERHQDDTFIWQWGNNPGYRAFVIASLRTGDCFVMLTNSENGLELAQPMAQKILPGEHRLFGSSILGTDVVNIVCNTLRVCL